MVRIKDYRRHPLDASKTDAIVRRAVSGLDFENVSRPLVIFPAEKFPGQWAVSFDTHHARPLLIAQILEDVLRHSSFHVLGPPQVSTECATLPMPRVMPRYSTHGTPGDRAH